MSVLAPIICDNGTGFSKVGYVLCLLYSSDLTLTLCTLKLRWQLRSVIVSASASILQ